MRPTHCMLAALALGGLVIMAAQRPPTDPGDARAPEELQAEQLPEVSVTLLGSTRQVKGLARRGGLRAEPVGSADLLRPMRLTIRLPDGRPVSLIARSMSLISEHGIVEDVLVRRPLKPVRSQEAVADLRRTLKELGIEPGDIMRRELDIWAKDDIPGFEDEGGIPYPHRTGTSAFDEVELSVSLSPDPRGGWYYLMSFGAEVEAIEAAQIAKRLADLPADKPTDGLQPPVEQSIPKPARAGELPEVSAPLLGSTRQVEGLRLHEALPKIWLSSPDLLLPHRLMIRLPDGKPLSLDARGMAMMTKYGVIEDVYVRRPMEPAPYEEAVADLRRTLEESGLAPDEAMKEQMAGWPADAPWAVEDDGPHDSRARMRLSEQVELEARIRPDPKGGWYSLLMLGATAEAREASRAANRPATRPRP